MMQALPAFHVQCSSLTPAGVVWGSLRRGAAGEGAEAHDLQPGEVFGACRSGGVFPGARRRGRRRGGLQLYQLRAAWGATGQLSGIWLGLWVSTSGGAAQSAYMFTEMLGGFEEETLPPLPLALPDLPALPWGTILFGEGEPPLPAPW